MHASLHPISRVDIVPGEFQVVDRPDIVSVEGLNVLQTGDGQSGKSLRVFVSDFSTFRLYIDAAESDIERLVCLEVSDAAANGVQESAIVFLIGMHR